MSYIQDKYVLVAGLYSSATKSQRLSCLDLHEYRVLVYGILLIIFIDYLVLYSQWGTRDKPK